MKGVRESDADPLPTQLSSFIGREIEIAAVRRMLGAVRLLTLTGAGGSGKTRLALEIAAQVVPEYADGVAWIELAALPDANLLAQHVAARLGIRDDSGRPATHALLHALRDRSMLLILDNCEHLADACAALADALLRGCARLTILATSREALGVEGERAWLVPPLSLPAEGDDHTPEGLLEFEAPQLFVARAQDVVPSFALNQANAAAVARVCRRLDGIPLAIELAAARVNVLTPEQIAQRLDNAFALLTSRSRTALPRHRTLRATIDWSYQLLSGLEQLLLQRLSIFAGGFTLDAAETICADERLEPWQVLDPLARLVDRSIVAMSERDGSARYHLLETVRQFARERLDEQGETDALRRRHADFFLEFAVAAEPHLFLGGNDPLWFSRVEAEIGNLRGAADWFDADPQGAESALRLAASVHWRWYHRGQFVEMRRWLERALERGGDPPAASRAQALTALAYGGYAQGEVAAALANAAAAVDLLRSANDPPSLAFALANFGVATATTGKHEPGEALLQEAIALARTLSPTTLIAPLGLAGYPAYLCGDYARAQRLYDEAFAIAVGLGFRFAAGQITTGRTVVALARGDEAEAVLRIRDGLELARETRDPSPMVLAMEALAALLVARQNASRAERLVAIAESFRERTGFHHRPFPTVNTATESVRQRLGDGYFAAARAEQRALSLEQAVDYAFASLEDAGLPTVSPASREASSAPATEQGSASTPAAASPPPAAIAAPYGSLAALRVLALGPVEIHREGELLSPELWRYAKPKELLLYLLSHPRGRTREQIGVVFWPESSAAQVKNSFHVTLHHLRKALGRHEWVVLENERYRINPALGCELDATCFQEQITAALSEARAGHGSAERLRTALALYRGDFLQDETVGDWHLALRDHLRRLYVDGLLALGELLMGTEHYAEAAQVYQQLVRQEDLHEEAHRRLMRCLARTGERGTALRHYERLRVLLRDELGAEPEAETTGLYERLKQAQTV